MSQSPTLTAKAIYAQLKAQVCDSNAKKDSLFKMIKKLGGKDIFRVRDGLGQTVLHLAAGEGNLAFFAALFEDSKSAACVNLEEKDNNDWRVLHCACNAGSLGVTHFAVTHGVDINAITIEGASCLHYFPKISPSQDPQMYEQTLNIILSNIKNINQQNKRGQTALHKAALEGTAKRPLLVKKLLSLKPSVNPRDSVGETALHVAARNGDVELIVALLDAGADINQLGEMGTPKQVAEDAGQKDSTKALRRWAKKHGLKLEGEAGTAKSRRNKVDLGGVSSPSVVQSRSANSLADGLRRVLRPANMLRDNEPENRAQFDSLRRQNIMTELAETEANYVKTIKDLLESFCEPLQKLSSDPDTALLSPIEVKLIFSGELPTLLRLHTNILTSLRQRLKTWDPETKISDIFHAIPSHGFCYKNYTSNFDTALDTVKKIITSGIVSNKSPQVFATNDAGIPLESDAASQMLDPYFQPTASRFLDWLHSRVIRRSHRSSLGHISASLTGVTSGVISLNSGLSGSGGQLTSQGGSQFVGAALSVNRMDTVAEFLQLLMSPLQRVGQYTSLLRSYISVTPPDHPDYHDITALYEQLVRVGESVLEVKVLAETRVKIVQITESLSGYTESLFRSDREFLREGPATFKMLSNASGSNNKVAAKNAVSTSGQLFLFNDLLMWAKKVPADKQNRTLAFVRSVLLKNVSAVSNADSSEPGNKCAFEVITGGGAETFVFFVENEEQRQSWISAIAAATSRAASHVMWIKVRPKGTYPSPRGSHSVVQLKNSLYLFGGHYFNTYFNDLYVFGIEKQQWTKLTSIDEGPSPRTEHAATAVDSQRFFMFGGFNGKTRLNDLWVFDSSEMSWLKIEPHSQSVPRERSGHKMVRCHGALYLFGGIDSTGTYLNDLWKLTISGDGRAIWQVIPYEPGEKVPEARAFHSMSNVGGRIVIFGGYSFKKCFDDLFVFDLESKSWVNPVEISPSISQQQDSGTDSVLGVESDSIVAPANVASSMSSSGGLGADGATPADTRPSARSRHAVFVYGDTLFFHGGNSYSGSSYLCDFWALKRAGSGAWGHAPVQWTKLALPLQLDSRYGHTISGPMLYKKSNKSVAVMFGGVSGLLTQYNFWNDVTIFKNLDDLLSLAGEKDPTTPRISDPPEPVAAKIKPRHSPSFSGMVLKSDPTSALGQGRSRAASLVPKTAAGRIRALSVKSGNSPLASPQLDFASEDTINIDEELAKPSAVHKYTGKGTLALTVDVVLSDPVFVDRCYVDSVICCPPASAHSSDYDPPEVYKAVYGDPISPKSPSLALKVFRNLKVNERMRAELSILRVARHTNVVPYFAMSEREGDAYLAQGLGLTNVMMLAYTTKHMYSERQVAIIAKAVLCALNFLHSCDIVAKSVRPENILITPDGLVQLADWGLEDVISLGRDPNASAAPTSSGKKEVKLSTPQQQRQLFMAPEMKKSSSKPTIDIECRSDIWSLGISLIYLCEPQKEYMGSGKQTGGEMETVRAIFNRSTSTLIKRSMFRDFIAHCLAPSPENRADAAALLKHPFIVENTSEFDKLAVESADTVACDTAEELAQLAPLAQQYQALRRNRSIDTAGLALRRETNTLLVNDGDEVPQPVTRKRSNSAPKERSISPGRKEKRIRQGSGSSNASDDDSKPTKKRGSDRRKLVSSISNSAGSSSPAAPSSPTLTHPAPVAATPPHSSSVSMHSPAVEQTPTRTRAESQSSLNLESSSEELVSQLQEVSSKLADKESEVEKLKQELAAEKARLEAEKADLAKQLRAQIEAEMRAQLMKSAEAPSPVKPTLTRVGRSNSAVFEKIALFEQTAADKASESSLSRKSSSSSNSSTK